MSNLSDISDENLLLLLKGGEVEAFDELYHRYWSKLYVNAYKRLKDKETCEEIVQDFFTSLWLNREKCVIHTSFSSYVYTSVRYLVFNYYQKEYHRKAYQEKMQYILSEQDNSTENLINLNELNRVLEERVETLPAKCRSVYELSRKQFKNNREISQMLGISEKTVENHLTKALRNLRVSVKDLILLVFIFFFS